MFWTLNIWTKVKTIRQKYEFIDYVMDIGAFLIFYPKKVKVICIKSEFHGFSVVFTGASLTKWNETPKSTKTQQIHIKYPNSPTINTNMLVLDVLYCFLLLSMYSFKIQN